MDRALDDLVVTTRGNGNRRGSFKSRGGFGAQRTQRRGGFGGAFQHDDRGSTFGHDDREAGGAERRTRLVQQRRDITPYSRSAAPGNVDTVWKHDLFHEEEEIEDDFVEGDNSGPRSGIETGTRLQITNLAYSVLSEDIKDLFESVGDVKRASVNFDKSGRSLGTATVVFARRADATAALKKYNNIPLDDQPMKISLVGSNLHVGGGGSSRVDQGNSFRAVHDEALTISVGAPRRRFVTQGLGSARRIVTGGRTVRVGGGGGGFSPRGGRRPRGGRGGGGGGGFGRKERLTAEELDAEMDAYNQDA